MNTSTRLLLLCLTSSVLLPVSARLPGDSEAMRTADLPEGAVTVRVENIGRNVKDGGQSASLDMSRLTVAGAFRIAPGVSPWLEAGWHDPEIGPGKSSGGFTWGAGLQLLPLLHPLRSDPRLGPRDWLALTLDLAVRGGGSSTRQADVDWLSVEGALGIEGHWKLMGVNRGPVGASAVTAGAGVVFNSLQAEQGAFDGSEDQAVGIRLHTGFSFGPNQTLSLQADWYGSSDRIFSAASGFRF